MRRLVLVLLRLLSEIVLGLAAVAAVGACLLGWRLAQGPLDVTWLVHRAQGFLPPPGPSLRVGGASLAWAGFDARDQPLDLRLRDVSLPRSVDGPQVALQEVRLGFAVGPLLLGRAVPSAIVIDGGTLRLQRRADGSWPGFGQPAGSGGGFGWPRGLRAFHVQDAAISLHDAAGAVDWQARPATLDVEQAADGSLAGSLHAALQAGDVHATLDVEAVPHLGGTRARATLTPVSPAALAGLSPLLSALSALSAPVGLDGSAELGPGFQLGSARLAVVVGPGTLAAGQGVVHLAEAKATLSGNWSEIHLETARIALAQPDGGPAAAPVITAQAAATRAAGGHATVSFGVDVDSVAMAELDRYWPAGTGGGARAWLVQNVTAGRVRQVHVAGSLDVRQDLSDATLASLSGGLLVDDATLWWLRPVPPLQHVDGRVSVEGPDSVLVTLDRGAQNGLALSAGSSLRITGLQASHQFGDVAVGLSGPLSDALAILNHPRLKLLSRGNVDVVDPAGTVRARLTLHVPLEDRVTMDDIPISATATLAGVHLGRIVGGRDLDRANLSLKVTGDGLDVGGDGSVAGIPAKLALQMDFRNGPPGQVLQHLTADGRATGPQLLAAGVPDKLVAVMTAGAAGLHVDYAGRRDGMSALQLDADLASAALTTPLGWSKPAGSGATAGARVLLNRGRLAGVENLHAEGLGLSIVSRAQLAPGKPRALLLDRFALGRTRGTGRITFPSGPRDPVSVRLSGPVLDLSSYLDTPSPPAAKAQRPAAPKFAAPRPGEAPGPPWSVNLAFDQVQLAHGRSVAPLTARAASDGVRILHAELAAGAPGQFGGSIVPDGSGRRLTLQADDAGLVLAAAGMADNLTGGALQLDGRFDDRRPGSPLTGTVTLQTFQVTQAAGIGRLLQGVTLYGLVDALRGPGLRFSKLVAPFRWQNRVLHLTSARAFSPSLGITAQGDIDLNRQVADVTGTVVPAYFFNQLLGNLPLVGRLFSPEKGGGVFAARYSVRGPLDNPKVGVNPLAALTPGFLREGFGLFSR